MKNRNILVTGGAGYVGSHACKALKREGWDPITYDNLVHGHEWAVKWGPLEHGDIRDSERLSEVFQKYMPQAVMHFAAHYAIGESVEDPAKYYQNNIVGSLELINAMRRFGCNRLVFSSSCAVYGVPEQQPIGENTIHAPANPYGVSKAFVERILFDYQHAYGLRAISLRYFNAAGADPEGETGEAHDPETHLIPCILDVASGRAETITVYGNDYDTPDGTCIRDYVHVADLAQAHVDSVKALIDGADTAAYNLGTGRGMSVLEMIRIVEKVTRCRVPIRFGARRQGDAQSLVAAADLSRRVLSWRPRHSDPEEIVATAWKWHQTQSKA